MLILIFVATLIPALLLGWFWVKRYQTSMKEERARKLKIAEGKFDELEEPKKKPGRLRGAVRRSFTFLKRKSASAARAPSRYSSPGSWYAREDNGPPPEIGTPDKLEAKARHQIPPAVEELLSAWRAYDSTIPVVNNAEQLYTKARIALVAHSQAFREHLRRGAGETWLQEYLELHAALRLNGREYATSHDELTPKRQRWMQSLTNLESTVKSCHDYIKTHDLDEEDLSTEYFDMVSIATVARKECGSVLDKPRQNKPPEHWREPSAGYEEVEALLPQLLQKVRSSLTALRRLAIAQTASERAYRAADDLTGSATYFEPSKPTEPEIKAFLESSFNWGESVQQHVQSARETLPELLHGFHNCSVAHQAVIDSHKSVFSALLTAALQQYQKRQRSFDEQHRREFAQLEQLLGKQAHKAVDSALKGTALGQLRQGDRSLKDQAENDSAKQSQQTDQRADWLSVWLDAPDHLKHVLFSPNAKSGDILVSLPLSDHGSAVSSLAQTILEELVKSSASADATLKRLAAELEARNVTRDQTQQETNNVSAVRNAVRKLGFAIGQSNAAKAKLTQIIEQPENVRKSHEPNALEVNADKYIRTYKRWRDDLSHNESLYEARAKRLDAQKQQVAERSKQLIAAVRAINHLLENGALTKNDGSLPSDLEAAIRTAGILKERYWSAEAAASPQDDAPPLHQDGEANPDHDYAL